MHQAYKVHSILKKGVHIESIAAYGNNVILGTRTGQLIMYSVDELGTVDLLMFNKNFSKNPITQMEAVSSESLLFLLIDNCINVCEISSIESNFAFINNAAVTKECLLFALNVKTPKSTAGVQAVIICCAVNKQLEFYCWKDKSILLLESKINLKSIPMALCWVDDVVCVGFKDKYVIYDISTIPPKEHKVTSFLYGIDPCILVIKNNMIGMSKGKSLVAIAPSEYIEPNNAKTNGSFNAGNGENAGIKNTIELMTWSSSLKAVVWDEPFAIGRVGNAIEIRNIGNGMNKDTLVQTIPELRKTKFLARSGKGCIYAAGPTELWCIRMVDISTQRRQLLQQKEFQLAIDLTNISDEAEQIKAETVRQIHMHYARELFSKKDFFAAMIEFDNASADVYDVIRLFPNLLHESNKSTEQYVDPMVPVVPVLQWEDEDLENATIALTNFLTLARRKETSKTILSIIDTTLLKCYLQTNDKRVDSLLRRQKCHFEESEKNLKIYGKTSELFTLYKTNGNHKKSLELLQSQATKEDSSLYGHEHTILYLQNLGSAHLNIIFEFSDWVLKKHGHDGLRIFTEDMDEVENLPRAKVLDFLLKRHKPLHILYLEHVINVWKDTNEFLNNVLVKQYREKVQTLLQETSLEPQNSQKATELKEYREKLYNLLKHSCNYSPEVVLNDFPTTFMLEERALILGRLKKHEKVLAIYIQILGDVEKAAQYCEEHYESDNDIFLILMKILLNPLKQPPYEGIQLHEDFLTINHDIVLDLLNKYADKINPNKVWPYLPDDMPLHRLKNYFDTALRFQMDETHHYHVMSKLLEAEIKRISSLISLQKSKCVEISEISVCHECKKRFSSQSAFVRYPSGEVVHISCHDKRTQSKIGAK